MKRETPKEVWLHHDKRTGWNFSFDPPLKRYEVSMHRMVSADSNAALRAEARRLRKALAPLANGSTYREHLDAGLAALKPKKTR